jgi:hypothetical protein
LLARHPAGIISQHSSSHHQQVILQFPAALPLPPLQPVLRLAFSYPLLEGLDGFYRSSFIGELCYRMFKLCYLCYVMSSADLMYSGLQPPAVGRPRWLLQEQLHR